jgi:hypothetical protein
MVSKMSCRKRRRSASFVNFAPSPASLRGESRDAYDWPLGAREILAAETPDFVVMMIGLADRQTIDERQIRNAQQRPMLQSREPLQPGQRPSTAGEQSQGDLPDDKVAPAATSYEFRSELRSGASSTASASTTRSLRSRAKVYRCSGSGSRRSAERSRRPMSPISMIFTGTTPKRLASWLAGPVVPLTATDSTPDELVRGGPPKPADPIATRVLVRGAPITAPTGRADDFIWPRPADLPGPLAGEPTLDPASPTLPPNASPKRSAASSPTAPRARPKHVSRRATLRFVERPSWQFGATAPSALWPVGRSR